ncbi:S24/S26 family peptidase [Methanofollis fontis]|uniref:S26 family signal peptidase n=1 Tax=Methanofollis fontis TaxID=2052832 RepID=A0A483CQY3_9EURY|nr:S26 family signal peptidase [Methanofollis fontis]TAJ45523.1 S26 family signal peptidase [Methanofollis fontis]
MSEKKTRSSGGEAGRSLIDSFRESDHPMVSIARDVLWAVAVVAVIALVLFLVSGTWPAVVAIESESMVPNMNVGDLVFVVAPDRFGPLQTWEDGQASGYLKYNDYGDVVIYRPNGADSVHPIIHRALMWVEANETVPMSFENGFSTTYTAPHEGYITKGDNNPVPDQVVSYPGLGQIEPVREEWVVGKALFAVPLLGYLPLHLIEVAVVIVVLMILWDIVVERRKSDQKTGKKRK